jgi:hypothetical protein
VVFRGVPAGLAEPAEIVQLANCFTIVFCFTRVCLHTLQLCVLAGSTWMCCTAGDDPAELEAILRLCSAARQGVLAAPMRGQGSLSRGFFGKMYFDGEDGFISIIREAVQVVQALW